MGTQGKSKLNKVENKVLVSNVEFHMQVETANKKYRGERCGQRPNMAMIIRIKRSEKH